jgi:hypothetical protein
MYIYIYYMYMYAIHVCTIAAVHDMTFRYILHTYVQFKLLLQAEVDSCGAHLGQPEH